MQFSPLQGEEKKSHAQPKSASNRRPTAKKKYSSNIIFLRKQLCSLLASINFEISQIIEAVCFTNEKIPGTVHSSTTWLLKIPLD